MLSNRQNCAVPKTIFYSIVSFFSVSIFAISVVIPSVCAGFGGEVNPVTERECEHSMAWQCKAPFSIALTGGIAHSFFKNGTAFLAIPSGTPIPYSNSDLPNNLPVMSIDFVAELYENFTADFAYAQQFSRSSNNGTLGFEKSAKAFTTALVYVFNPEDRFRIGLAGGAVISANVLTITVNRTGANVTALATDINPQVGLGAVYQLNAKLAVKGSVIYQIAVDNRTVNGAVGASMGLAYYP